MTEEIYASFWSHVEDLRQVFLRSFVIIILGIVGALFFYQEIIQFLILSLPIPEFYLFSPAEGFIAIFRCSFWLGVLSTSPFWLKAILQFFLPALKTHEKKWLLFFCFFSFFFITAGLIICLKITLPLANSYLFAFNQSVGINMWGFAAYVDFIIMMILAHALAFEMGALLFFLVHIGTLQAKTLIDKRRYAIIAALIIGAILTPPDILTQLCVAIPLIVFYELAILYSKIRI